MKVKCINNYFYNLTIGKIYEVIDIDVYIKGWYLIINDKGNRDWYDKECFKSLSEIRNDKIDKLLR